MTNVELKNKIDEIIAIDDFFDRQIAINAFENEYKKTDFFKITKKHLDRLINEYRINNILSVENLKRKIQETIDGLSLEQFENILDQFGETFGAENKNVLNAIDKIKDLIEDEE